jgi:hypothetical protein
MKVNNACHDIFQLKTQKCSSKREHTIIPHQQSIKTLKNEREKPKDNPSFQCEVITKEVFQEKKGFFSSSNAI